MPRTQCRVDRPWVQHLGQRLALGGALQCAAVNCTGPVLRPHPELPGPRSHAVEPSGVPMRELDTRVLKSVAAHF